MLFVGHVFARVCVIPKALEMVPVVTLIDAQHEKAGIGKCKKNYVVVKRGVTPCTCALSKGISSLNRKAHIESLKWTSISKYHLDNIPSYYQNLQVEWNDLLQCPFR